MKRRLLIAGIFLLAGAVVNVAVAWVVVSYRPLRGLSVVLVEPTEQQTAWWRRQSFGVGLCCTETNRLFGWTRRGFVSKSRLDIERSDQSFVVIYEAGLPMRCLSGNIRGEKRGRRQPDVINELSSLWRYPGVHNPPYFPLRPIWYAFAVNTTFYAAVLWLLIPGPFALRRFIRVKRGRCPACAYPVGESAVCSECGTNAKRNRDQAIEIANRVG